MEQDTLVLRLYADRASLGKDLTFFQDLELQLQQHPDTNSNFPKKPGSSLPRLKADLAFFREVLKCRNGIALNPEEIKRAELFEKRNQSIHQAKDSLIEITDEIKLLNHRLENFDLYKTLKLLSDNSFRLQVFGHQELPEAVRPLVEKYMRGESLDKKQATSVLKDCMRNRVRELCLRLYKERGDGQSGD